MTPACDPCLTRSWLLGALSGHLERGRGRILNLLGLANDELIAAVAGRRGAEIRRRLEGVDPQLARAQAKRLGLELVCRCQASYPSRLRALAEPPRVLHVAGMDRLLECIESETVAVVGSRQASPYGVGVARSLARGLTAAGIPVISGMATGVDSAAHEGALELAGRDGAGRTLTVLPGGADLPYPRSNRRLYRRLQRHGAVISELPPGVPVRSWMFRARNRIIAALASMTIVIEAGEHSGSLVTAHFAHELTRELGAVPGRVTSGLSSGPHALLRAGAHLIRGAQDVVDVLFEAGSRAAPLDERPQLDAEQQALLGAIAEGHDTAAALTRRGILPERGLAALATLELLGYLERGPGGRFLVLP